MLRLKFVEVPAGLYVDLLAGEILHIETQIRHAPSDVTIVSQDHGGDSGQGSARDIESIIVILRLQMHEVPSGWQVEFQVRIVRENRFAAGGVASGYGPGVRAGH